MGSSAKTDYCAFTKAVEHLGDRWSFLIVRELAMIGAQGFNILATGLPGHISRSVWPTSSGNSRRSGSSLVIHRLDRNCPRTASPQRGSS